VGHLHEVRRRRIGQQDLVPRVGQREQHGVQDLDAAGADDDLIGRRRVAVDPPDLLRERLAQRDDAGVRPVLGVPVASHAGGGLDDVRRRGEARLADLEMNRVRLAPGELHDLTDRLHRQPARAGGDLGRRDGHLSPAASRPRCAAAA
jgi:hypothetical protein